MPKDTTVEVELDYNVGSLVPESVQCCVFSEKGNRGCTHWNKAKVRKNWQIVQSDSSKEQVDVTSEKDSNSEGQVRDTVIGTALSHTTRINYAPALVMPLK